MITFDSNNIIVGEIKQFLKDFNLPKAVVLSDERTNDSLSPRYIPNKIYIDKDTGEIFRSSLDGSSISQLANYKYDWDNEYKNITHKLNITSNVYDSYTHKYFGQYLRFLRDFRGIDLMCMYNCFSREYAEQLFYQDENNPNIIFDTDDKLYKIYKVPVVAGNIYTIAITSSRPIEIISGYYKEDRMISGSYMKQNSCSSKQVFIYDKLQERRSDKYNYHRDDDLYMFLKIPAMNTSSIVILEGDYSNSTNVFINDLGFTEICSTTLTQRANFDKSAIHNIPRLQLLACRNNNISYAFSDKLVEYIFNNVITEIDTIPNNIKKAQKKLNDQGFLSYIKYYGSWTDAMTTACINCSQTNTNHRYLYKDYDMIGYVDSDVEAELGGLE